MLEVKNLVRKFGELTAVDDVSFHVPAGKVTGFVGGNGAGKTTTMRMIMGLLTPNSGAVEWLGQPMTRAVRARFGYMPEERGLYPKQSVIGQLTYLGELHGMSSSEARKSITEMLGHFGLQDRLKDKLETLSLGNQQRVQIAAALLANPIGLVLDEPFSGLDPDAVEQMYALLNERLAAGVPVLFSSHQLDLVERLADHIVILTKGRVVAAGTVAELIASQPYRHRLVSDTDLGWLRSFTGVEDADVDGPTATFRLPDEAASQPILSEAMKRGSVFEFARLVPSLAEIYRGVTK